MWTVDDVMTREVVTVQPTTAFKELAQLMADRNVSALPVVDVTDAGARLVGIVSEADLIVKAEAVDPRQGPAVRTRGDQGKVLARTARELMSTPVVTARPQDTLARAAHLMYRWHVKRLPVVDPEGHLVGIVSRSDLTRVFLRSDETIRHQVVDVLGRTLRAGRETIAVSVDESIVTLEGEVETQEVAGTVARLVGGIEGVVAVDNRLTFGLDDAQNAPALRGLEAASWRRRAHAGSR